MIDFTRVAAKFLLLLLLCVEYDDHQFVAGGREVRCIKREREALLRFKHGLIDEYGVLSSWGSDDDEKECCKWKGVHCSNTTGHVIGLLLGAAGYDDRFRGKISSSLLELRHLNNLDLSGNDFGGDQIPEFIGSIKNLRHLNLEFTNFSGIVPPQLGNLTNLRTLDLSDNYFLRFENLNWISSLSLLNRLDLSHSNISDTNWLHPVLKLRSLQELYLQNCKITDIITLSAGQFVNSSATLSILDLKFNRLTSSTFDWLCNISTSLVKLDMSDNRLSGMIPDAFGRLIFLEYLDFSRNMLEGEIPKSLGNLSHLQTLSLNNNDFEGHLEELFENLFTIEMVSLQLLDLSYNQLTGPVPDLRDFSGLRKLYLRNNQVTGTVPISLAELSKLEVLDVSFNSLEGIISERNFIKLHNLKVLDLSFNSLTMQIASDWIPPFQLYVINLACCNMGKDFPRWIHTQSNLTWLDLSCASISGEVPKWLWGLSPTLKYLNLSHNQINGTISDLSSNLIQEIDVSSNKFSGPIPLFHADTWIIQLSQNMFSGSIASICTIPLTQLALLDLSNNQLVGELPNCWEKMEYLGVLNLANNSFSGEIPHSLGSIQSLQTLHLRDNNLSGELPSTWKNCQRLFFFDIGGNKITGNIPTWIGVSCASIWYLSLRHNRFYGSIPHEICSLTLIQTLDLSENNISGEIPKCFNNFTGLAGKNATIFPIIQFGFYLSYEDGSPADLETSFIEYATVQWKGQELEYRKTLGLLKLIDLSSNRLVGTIPVSFSEMKGLISLNLSRNSLTGNIIPDINQMEMLESLDLSRNQLSGEIPTGLAQLHYLAVLDLANNNLWGKIPSSTQLQSFDASAYAENKDLCGHPLPLCPEENLSPSTNEGEKAKEREDGFLSLSLMKEFGIAMAFGFIFGFWGVIGSFLLKKSWRLAYFNFLDAIEDWLYVTTTIFFNKFK